MFQKVRVVISLPKINSRINEQKNPDEFRQSIIQLAGGEG
ncbi:hypothetical protein J2Z37_003211 [Ammoniphilus resinae]|uniref:Uncharacterized protein n=1 Tax=Ammoniphilus resinae TaxID=861532 RepID=A0ABS4GSD1_9BACL|nr:hypothetical protein [Ammoniphilus resinae]